MAHHQLNHIVHENKRQTIMERMIEQHFYGGRIHLCSDGQKCFQGNHMMD